jgi:hypothetical protein
MLLSKQSKNEEYYLLQLIASKEKTKIKTSKQPPAVIETATTVEAASNHEVNISDNPEKMKPLTAFIFLFAPIAGGLSGGVFGLLIGLAVSFYLYKRHNKKQKKKQG